MSAEFIGLPSYLWPMATDMLLTLTQWMDDFYFSTVQDRRNAIWCYLQGLCDGYVIAPNSDEYRVASWIIRHMEVIS